VKRSLGLAVGLLAGVAVDSLTGDPKSGHPVAAFGRIAGAVEQRLWRDSRASGTAFVATCVGGVACLGLVIERATSNRLIYPVAVAAVTWTVLGGQTLRREALALHDFLDRDDLPGARERLTHLVGRDPTGLDESEISRAAVESVAENTSDAIVAPLVWGAVAGVPGLLAYRSVNTLDAMVGDKSDRYLRFGWAAARLDDVANLVPARFTALLVAMVGGQPKEVWRVTRRDARQHPSPNAGWCEAAFAGSLGLRLGGVNVYGDRTERRPTLGDGSPATRGDLHRSARLSRRVTWAAAVAAAGFVIARNR
jgi:adenosylcobinamide-phosphate synthase